MAKRVFNVAALLSAVLHFLTLGLLAVLARSPDDYVTLTDGCHVGFDSRKGYIVVFSDAEFGLGACAPLTGVAGDEDTDRRVDESWRVSWWGFSYQFIPASGEPYADWWMLRVHLWYPYVGSGVLPIVWLARFIVPRIRPRKAAGEQ